MRLFRREKLTVIVIASRLHGLMKMGAPGGPLVCVPGFVPVSEPVSLSVPPLWPSSKIVAELDCAVGEQVC